MHPTAFADTRNMAVSAFIGPQTNAYQFSLAQQDGGPNVSNGKYYAYTLTYGAKQSAFVATSNTITFDWSKALATNGQNMFDYVYGSASDGYGGAKPIIDITHKTITWNIPNLPPGTTDQKLVFLMFTNSYKSSSLFPLYLTATMTNQYVTISDPLTVYYNYQTPPPGPTATPGPQPTATPTPPPPPPPLYSVTIPGISDNNASVNITTAYPSKLSISYGTSETNLYRTISSNDYTYQNSITLSDLVPDTTYYFTFTITSKWGYSTTSELYTFHTAKKSSVPNVENNVIVFTANGNVYFSNTQEQDTNTHPSVILTENGTYQISYAITNATQVKSIEAIILNKILGANALATIQLPSILILPMQEEKPNLFVIDINALTTGLYEVYVRVTDKNGNMVQKKISDLKIMPRFTVYAADTNQPLQDARVFLYAFDSLTRRFLPLNQQYLGNPNPGYTNAAGQLTITLPAGRYRVEESAFLYNKITTDFTIGSGANQDFPIVYLKRDPLNIASLMAFVKDYLGDTWNKMLTTLLGYSASIRLFNLFAVGILGSFVIINFLLFTLRAQIKAHHLPVFFLFHVDQMMHRHTQKYIYGVITDEAHNPVSQVQIEIEDRDTKRIVMTIYTNKTGRFYCRNMFAGEINLILSKQGYEITAIPLNALSLPDTGLQLSLKRGTKHYHSTDIHIKETLLMSLGVLFETSLVITLFLEFLFFSLYGFGRTAPYLALSILNILLWLFYIHEHAQKTEI